MLIEDGTGSGRTVKVNGYNKIECTCTNVTIDHCVNHSIGESYMLLAFKTPDITSDPSIDPNTGCFCYIKNTNSITMIIKEIKFWAENTEYVDVYVNDVGDPIGGTTTTPINMNLGSGNLADGIFSTGTNITGLSGATLIDRFRIPDDNNDHIVSWAGDMIVPKNNVLTLYAGTGGIPIEASIQFYYHGC